MNVLRIAGYVTFEGHGRAVVQLTRIQKECSVQRVAGWMRRPQDGRGFMPGADVLLGELRQQLEANGLPPLRDEAETEQEYDRTIGFQQAMRKREKPAYPAGTILDQHGRPVK